ncbi:MAG TPA: ElyC/SanA/YdcF family protein [Polyangia bacterium]|nr:ElyC/SanA/YdcF family protein [Polyangia bacterium]
MAAHWARLRRLIRNAVLLGLAALVAANIYAQWSTADVTFQRAAEVPSRPTAIVLGTHVNRGVPSQELAERLQAAADLYSAGKVSAILVSGGVYGNDQDEPGAMARWLVGRGVPAAAVTQDRLGIRTRATMERAAQVFGVRAAAICTQAYHLPRALILARKAGIDAVGLIGDSHAAMRHSLREILARPAMLLETLIWPLGRGS